MGIPTDKPFSAVCPRTGSRVFIRDDLLHLTAPIEVVCSVCGHRHVWIPETLRLSESDAATID